MNPFARINLIEPSMSHKNGAVQQQRQLTSDTPKWKLGDIGPSSPPNPVASHQKRPSPFSLVDVATKNKRVRYYSQ